MAGDNHDPLLPVALRAEMARMWAGLEIQLPAAAACRRCGTCCDFPRSGHRLFAEELEVLFAVDTALSWIEGNLERGWCPFYERGRCANREGRPLGCRTYFCDYDGSGPAASERRARCEDLHERFLRRLREKALRWGIPRRYRPFLDGLARLEGAGYAGDGA